MSMDGTVDVPAVGRVPKKYVAIGAAVVAGIVGYAWWRNASAPVEDIPAYTDEDIISDGIANTPGGVAGGSANSGGLDVDNSTTPDTDNEWVMLAKEALAGTFDDAALSIALGRYISRESLTAAQADMVRAAIGSVGYPPGGKYPIDTATGAQPSTLTEPRNVRVTAKDASSVTLAWDPVPGAQSYRAYHNRSPMNVGATDAPNTTMRVAGLQPGTSYDFRIAADTIGGFPGPKSAPVKVTTGQVSLKAPTGVKVTQITKSTALVSWSRVSGAQLYRIYLDNHNRGSRDGSGSSYKVTGLTPGKRYVATVSADTTTGAPGPQSRGVAFTTKRK